MSDKEGVGRDTQGGVMMETHPASPLVVREAELLLEFLVVTLDAPAHLGYEDQLLPCGVARAGREEVFGWFGLTFRPFDQQPLLGTQLSAEVIAMRRTKAYGSEPGG